MAITRTPLKDLLALQDRMNRLFEGAVDRSERSGEEFEAVSWAPPVDIYEARDDVVVKVEVPGVDKEGILVEVKDDVLVIKGERPFEKDVAKEQFHRIERPYGKFRRSFVLGIPVRVEKIKAAYREGVLEIILPKTEKAKPKKIEISGE